MGIIFRKHTSLNFARASAAVAMSLLGAPALAWDIPTNLRESNDVLYWNSNAPSYNVYEDGAYVATVHGATSFRPIFDQSVYQVVAHERGMDFSALSVGFLFSDDKDQDDETDENDTLLFDETEVYFELNNTDGDLGIHSKVDGDAWTRLMFEDVNGRKLIDIKLKGAMAEQGLTELFFESSEPTFDEVSPAEFFSRFPGGVYDVEGLTLDGDDIEGEALLSQVLPAAPIVYVGANAATPLNGCADDPMNDPAAALDEFGGLPVRWDPVTSSHPEIGAVGDIEVALYQFVLEGEDIELTVNLDPDSTEFTIPASLISSGDSAKLEVLVRDGTHNQVATEVCVILI